MVASEPVGLRNQKVNIVLTGASSGIGKFLAETLTTRGHEVCRIARAPQAGFSFQCDVSDWHAIENCAKKISEKWRAVDALICCAGIQEPIGPAMEIDPLAWRKNLAVNLDGTFFAIRALYPLLKKSSARSKSDLFFRRRFDKSAATFCRLRRRKNRRCSPRGNARVRMVRQFTRH